MHYGEPGIRKAVPLALGLLCASNPVVNVLDVLSKYSHDNDQEVAINAIFGMGLVGAGTNNARLAQMLRQLAAYYHKEPNCLFAVRLAQVRRLILRNYRLNDSKLTFPQRFTGPRSHGQGNNDDQPLPHEPHAHVAKCRRWSSHRLDFDDGCKKQ
jgi:hypothetical protein